MRSWVAVSAGVLAVMLGSCSRSGADDGKAPQVRAERVAVTDDMRAAAEGGNVFALELHRGLASGADNLFISPVSVSMAFGMTYAGARSTTAEEIARVLHYDLPPDRLHAALGGLSEAAALDAPGRELAMANALWAQSGLTLRPEFTALVKRHYRGGVRLVDYRQAPEAAVAAVNGWAAEQTNGRIRSVLTLDDVDQTTRLILTNAVYFKADWRTPFPKSATRPGPFAAPGGPVQTPLMRQETELRHVDGGSFQLLELPYTGGETSMLVWLPKAADGLPALEAALTAPEVRRRVGELQAAVPAPVNVTLPRFTLRQRLSLKKQLIAMGMGAPFDNRADFGGFTDEADLLITDVLQETFVAVDEVGTEAAAVTAVVTAEVSAGPQPVEFRADRPFVFMLRDNRTGALLFIGRLTTPPA